MGFGRTSKASGAPIETLGDAPADTAADLATVSDQAAPAIPDLIVATGEDGNERPLSGGSYIRIDGKLQRREA